MLLLLLYKVSVSASFTAPLLSWPAWTHIQELVILLLLLLPKPSLRARRNANNSPARKLESDESREQNQLEGRRRRTKDSCLALN